MLLDWFSVSHCNDFRWWASLTGQTDTMVLVYPSGAMAGSRETFTKIHAHFCGLESLLGGEFLGRDSIFQCSWYSGVARWLVLVKGMWAEVHWIICRLIWIIGASLYFSCPLYRLNKANSVILRDDGATGWKKPGFLNCPVEGSRPPSRNTCIALNFCCIFQNTDALSCTCYNSYNYLNWSRCLFFRIREILKGPL